MRNTMILALLLLFGCTTFSLAQVIRGRATYYHQRMHGCRTASGVRLNNDSMMCAHRTLPFGTLLQVRNMANDKEVIVRVVDRGPFTKRFIIDLTMAAARKLDFVRNGHTEVEITVLDEKPAPIKPITEQPVMPLDIENDSTTYTPTWEQQFK